MQVMYGALVLFCGRCSRLVNSRGLNSAQRRFAFMVLLILKVAEFLVNNNTFLLRK